MFNVKGTGTTVTGRYGFTSSSGRTAPQRAAADQAQQSQNFDFNGDVFALLLRTLWKKTKVLTLPFVATNAAPINILPEQPERCYFFIQNQSGVNQLVVNFGAPAGATGLIPVNGVILQPLPGFYEPIAVPTNEVWVSASAGSTPGIVVYALQN